MSVLTVLCIDIGYSLAKAYELYKENDYPGHLLYGINHLYEYGIKVVFQNRKIGSRLKCNFNAIKDALHTSCDCIYIPFVDWGIGVALLRSLKIIKKPIVALAHGYEKANVHSISLFKRIIMAIEMSIKKKAYMGCDMLIFISQKAYNEYSVDTQYKKTKQKAVYLPLQPEIYSNKNSKTIFNGGLVSIGKTNREYSCILKYAELHPSNNLLIVDNNFETNKKLGNVTVISEYLHFKQIRSFYENADAILIPVKETGGGIYGLSSVLDALAFCKPIIASQTEGLGIDIDSIGLGKTYKCGDVDSFEQAVRYVKENYKMINERISDYTKNYNINSFTNKLSEYIIDTYRKGI